MENRPPSAVGKGQHDAKGSSEKETITLRTSTTPTDNDPLWEELGATRVTDSDSDASVSSSESLSAPANLTEMAPSRVLGKDIVALGGFQLIRKLGEGAMGAVYKAKQITFKRFVALKILFPHVANNPKLVARLYREGQVMGRLDHPNIIQAYAVDEAEGFHYVAMEYVSGQSVQKWLQSLKRLELGDAVRIILDSAKALAYAHSLNMVHRDIKPDNILLTKTGVVKVADLGMVKTSDEDMSLTQTGHAVGTPWYMPLEQARNAKEIDGRSDIYALGCTFYALLTGAPPFMGQTIVDVIQAKEVGTFPPARQSNAEVPERIDLIIAKMTAKLPKYRYQKCEDLIKDLESLGLASESLTFLTPRPSAPAKSDEVSPDVLSKTTVVECSSKSDTDASSPVPAFDADVWYVQTKLADGTTATRRYGTAQLQKMLADGTIAPNAKASHSPTDGFRSIATYREFQGSALSKVSKKAADKSSARYRNLYKKIEQEERKKEEAQTKTEDTAVRANTRYWLSIALIVLPIALGIIGLSYFIYWVGSGLLR